MVTKIRNGTEWNGTVLPTKIRNARNGTVMEQSDLASMALTQDVKVGGCARLTQTWLRRRQKHNYVCSKDTTVVRRAVLTQTEVRVPSTSSSCEELQVPEY